MVFKRKAPETGVSVSDTTANTAKKVRKDVPETATRGRPKRGLGDDKTEQPKAAEKTTGEKRNSVDVIADMGGVSKRGRGRPSNASKGLQTVSPVSAKKGVPKKVGKRAKAASYKAAAEKRRDSKRSEQLTSKHVDDALYDEDGSGEEDPNGKSYWLMKAEPESRIEKGHDVKFSIDDLEASVAPEPWDGIRNLEARNNIRAMMKGDLAFFYHSNCKTPGIVGTMEIVEEQSVDESAFDENHPYFDPKSDKNNPKWFVVRVALHQKFNNIISLKELQQFSKPGGVLENLQTLKRQRLSVSKVLKKEWDFIMNLANFEIATPKQAVAQPELIVKESTAVNGVTADAHNATGSAHPRSENGEQGVEPSGETGIPTSADAQLQADLLK